MFLTTKDKIRIYAEAIGAVSTLNVSSSGGRNKLDRVRVFCSLKAYAFMTQNQRKTVPICYRSIATKREMIRHTVVTPDASHDF